MEQIISVAVKLIFTIISALLTAYVIPVIKKHFNKNMVKTAVEAAEKMYQESGKGPIKFDYVVSFLVENKILKLDIDGNLPSYWKALIESCCEELDILWNDVKDKTTK